MMLEGGYFLTIGPCLQKREHGGYFLSFHIGADSITWEFRCSDRGPDHELAIPRGARSAQAEHTVLITYDGVDVLTA